MKREQSVALKRRYDGFVAFAIRIMARVFGESSVAENGLLFAAAANFVTLAMGEGSDRAQVFAQLCSAGLL
ncbi:hypothetical protein [Tahibacter caeni]|uniref:hypothetical protein n=1 Tax=Tahibacter caeni TaxID=1453545 RepID=UPI0021478E7E|nr:hypothetical protein [Tahibacter caeni]